MLLSTYDFETFWSLDPYQNTLFTSKKNNNGGCFWKTWKSGIKTTAWSNLEDCEYKDIITLISGYLADPKNSPNLPVTILEAEFVIWYEAKNGYSNKGNKKYSY